MGQWTLEFQTFRDHVTDFVLKDENGVPLNIAGWFLKIDVEHDDATLSYSTATGHIVIGSPTTAGKAIFTLPKAEIADLPFDWAAFSFFAGASSAQADLIYEGKAHRV